MEGGREGRREERVKSCTAHVHCDSGGEGGESGYFKGGGGPPIPS
jgi:hypothetical protein